MICNFCNKENDCISLAQIKELDDTRSICISCLLVKYTQAKGISIPDDYEPFTPIKQCAICGDDLYVAWDGDPSIPEVCDNCFQIEMRRIHD